MRILLQNSVKLFTIVVLFFTFSCKDEEGCTDITACNYNSSAEDDDGSCSYSSCHTASVEEIGYSSSSCGFPMKVNFFAEYRANGLSNKYSIDYGDGSTSEEKTLTDSRGELTANHTYSTPGEYEVSIRITSTRGKSIITEYAKTTINLSKPNFSHSMGNTTCEGTSVSFTNNSISNLGTQYLWDFGDNQTSSLENPTHFFKEPGSYKVKFTVLCSDGTEINFIEKEIEIEATTLTADFSSQVNQYSCTTTSVIFSNLSTYSSNYLWDFGDGQISTDKNPLHDYATSGTYTVILKSFCKDTSVIQKQVVINPFEYEAQYSYSNINVSCEGTTIKFTNTSKETSDTKYLWDFGDGTSSTEENPTHIFSTAGTYDVNLKILCGNDIEKSFIQKQVKVEQQDLIANFTNSITSTNCEGTTIKFSNSSSYEANYHWDFGDGTISTSKNPSHTYTSSGAYTVTLKSFCSDTSVIQKEIQVSPITYNALFSYSTISTTCSGSTIKFNNTSTTTTDVTYTWSFGDGQTSTSTTPTHTYTTSGTYDVNLKIFCGTTLMDSYQNTIQINTLQPIANFQYSFFNNNTHAPVRLTLENTSQNASSYKWYIDNKLVSTNELFDYELQDAGTYSVKLVASCGDKENIVNKNITVLSEYSNMRVKTIELELPSNLVPDDEFDNTYGLDPYISLYYNDYENGYSYINSDVTKYPIFFDFPEDTYSGSFTLKNIDFFSNSTITVYVLDDDSDINEEIYVPSFSTSFILDEYYPETITLSNNGKIVTMYVEYY